MLAGLDGEAQAVGGGCVGRGEAERLAFDEHLERHVAGVEARCLQSASFGGIGPRW